MLEQLDIDTEYRYHDPIEYRILRIKLRYESNPFAILTPQYKLVYKKLPLKYKIWLKAKRRFPFLVKMKNILRNDKQ